MGVPMVTRDTELKRHAPPRLLVLSAVRLLRDAIARALDDEGFTMVRFASPVNLPDSWSDEVINETPDEEPDVVLADISSPRMLECVSQLAARYPHARIIAFGVDDDEADVLACAEAGVAGFLGRESGSVDLRRAIDSVIRDELICSPGVAAALLRRVSRTKVAHAKVAHTKVARTNEAHGDTARIGASAQSSSIAEPPHADARSARLTSRERQVLALVDRGLSNKEIGTALHISVATVKHHVHNILEKMQVRRRWAAAAQLHLPLDEISP